jgi:hypothetical protein
MSRKPIEFEPVRVADKGGDAMTIRAIDDYVCLKVACAVLQFTDPAKLDALADAIKRAADALRKSQQVTFGDLKPGEWFQFAEGNGRILRRVDGQYKACDTMGEVFAYGPPVSNEPVIRLRATFEPFEDEGGES